MEEVHGLSYNGSEDHVTDCYRKVFTGMVRGIDYMTSHSEWNHRAIISSDSDWCGGLAIIAAVVSVAPTLAEHTGPAHNGPSKLTMGSDKKTPIPKWTTHALLPPQAKPPLRPTLAHLSKGNETFLVVFKMRRRQNF